MPLKSPEEINQRLDIVDHFIRQEDRRLQAENFLESIGDLERLASKIGVGPDHSPGNESVENCPILHHAVERSLPAE